MFRWREERERGLLHCAFILFSVCKNCICTMSRETSIWRYVACARRTKCLSVCLSVCPWRLLLRVMKFRSIWIMRSSRMDWSNIWCLWYQLDPCKCIVRKHLNCSGLYPRTVSCATFLLETSYTLKWIALEGRLWRLRRPPICHDVKVKNRIPALAVEPALCNFTDAAFLNSCGADFWLVRN
jgi:hypothetical protein